MLDSLSVNWFAGSTISKHLYVVRKDNVEEANVVKINIFFLYSLNNIIELVLIDCLCKGNAIYYCNYHALTVYIIVWLIFFVKKYLIVWLRAFFYCTSTCIIEPHVPFAINCYNTDSQPCYVNVRLIRKWLLSNDCYKSYCMV